MGLPSVLENLNGREPWEQIEGETDRAFEAFCSYINLQKRGRDPRRYLTDLATQRGVKLSSLAVWHKRWEWDARADAYDAYMVAQPVLVEELAQRKQLAREWRETGAKFREKARQALELLDPSEIKANDAIALMKLGVDLENKANKMDAPETETARKNIKDEIRTILDKLAGGVGGLAAGASPGSITAVERTVRFDLPCSDDHGTVRQVQELPGEVCIGSSGGALVGGADTICEVGGEE